ncbi:MAG: regulatory protein RecX [Clostridia bacterium]|nr:regulatory protein RecX [Clostridia bacterium]
MTDEIVSVKRMHGVAHVKLQCGEMFRFPSVFLSERPLRAGRMVDREEYLAFVRSRALPFALDRAVKLQAMREHTEKEIAAALRRSAYPESIIAQVMDMLTASELVSDERFAEQWVRHRARTKGRRMIAMEMKQKGVDEETAREALEELSFEGELAAARKLAGKLLKQGKDMQHAMQSLLRRGYSYTVCKQALGASFDEADM